MITDEKKQLKKWIAKLPKKARKSASSHPPNQLYRMIKTGHIVPIVSYSNDGSVTVAVVGKFNLVTMERAVSGVPVSELEPCDEPGPDVPTGVVLDEDEQLTHLNKLRVNNGLQPIESLRELERFKLP